MSKYYGDRWTWKQQRFQEWLALPKSDRPEGFQHQYQVAEALGVHFNTLVNWKRLPGFWEAVYSNSRSIIGMDIPEILASMSHQAKTGSVSAAKLCLQVLEVLKEEQTHKIEYTEPLTVILSPNQELPKSQESPKSIPSSVESDEEPDQRGLEIVYQEKKE